MSFLKLAKMERDWRYRASKLKDETQQSYAETDSQSAYDTMVGGFMSRRLPTVISLCPGINYMRCLTIPFRS